MWLIFYIFCLTYSYHIIWMMSGELKSWADLAYRAFMAISCAVVAFVLAIYIPNDKFWWWNPWQ